MGNDYYSEAGQQALRNGLTADEQSALEALEAKLVGAIEVSPGDQDGLYRALLHHGCFFDSYGKEVRPGRTHDCHTNTYELVRDGGAEYNVTGLAVLHSDGPWREHSWGLSERTVIETTVPRDAYYGYNTENRPPRLLNPKNASH